jgi:hypothetical protein
VVQIVENWSRIEGTVADYERPADPAQPGVLHVRVERVTDVTRDDGSTYRSMLGGSEGAHVRIQVPAAVASTLEAAPGDRITLDVRRGRTPTRLFARAESIRVSS